MSKPPLPEAAVAMLRKPNPGVITTLRPDGQPVATATWYLWDNGRVLVSMDEGRKRLGHMRNDPRVALDVLAAGHRPAPPPGQAAARAGHNQTSSAGIRGLADPVAHQPQAYVDWLTQ